MTRGQNERGFTLVELMVAITIMGIIAATASMLFAFTLGTTEQTSERFSDSRGPKFLSSYWIPDVTSSLRVNLNSGPCGGGTPLVTLSWTDDRATFGDVTASWFTDATATARGLVRRECRNGNLSTPIRTTVVVPRIAVPGASVECDAGTCVEDQLPSSVRIFVTTPNGLTYSVDATRQLRSTQ